jgi:hypothetical protein
LSWLAIDRAASGVFDCETMVAAPWKDEIRFRSPSCGVCFDVGRVVTVHDEVKGLADCVEVQQAVDGKVAR